MFYFKSYCCFCVFYLIAECFVLFKLLFLFVSVRKPTTHTLTGSNNKSVIYKQWRRSLKGAVTPQ